MPSRPLSWIVALVLLRAPPLLAQAEVPGVDPKGRFTVYIADADTDGVQELYRSVIETGQRLKLSGTLTSSTSTGSYLLDPKGRYVVYSSEQAAAGVIELYRSDLNTGEQLKLNSPLAPGGNVFTGYSFGPKGRYVVYRADQDSGQVLELYVSNLKTGAIQRLNAPLPFGAGTGFFSFRLDPKGRYVVYVADEDTDEVREIYRSKLSNGAPLKLNDSFVDGGNVTFN